MSCDRMQGNRIFLTALFLVVRDTCHSPFSHLFPQKISWARINLDEDFSHVRKSYIFGFQVKFQERHLRLWDFHFAESWSRVRKRTFTELFCAPEVSFC